MKIKALRTLITLFTLAPAFANAQIEPGTGLFKPGTTFEMTTVNAEPVFWVNAANEVNVYFVANGNATLLTLLDTTAPAFGELPTISRVSYSDHGFLLHGEKDGYFFGTGTTESEQYKRMMKFSVKGVIKSYDGNGVARHWWPTAAAPSLADLKAAKSVYDVLKK